MSRERNYARNSTRSKSKRETKEEMDGQCGRMVGIIKRKVAARNRGQERMEKNRLQCDQPSYRGRLKRERERAEIWFEISAPPAPPSQLSYILSTLTVHCRWEDETAKESTDHPPSYISRLRK